LSGSPPELISSIKLIEFTETPEHGIFASLGLWICDHFFSDKLGAADLCKLILAEPEPLPILPEFGIFGLGD